MFRRLLNGLAAVAGATSSSQFPTYYQQYVQRLGGRLDQAQVQVERIEAAARENGLTVAQYIERFTVSADPAHRQQAIILREELADLDRLRQAVEALAQAHAIERPWRFLQHIDVETARAALGDFGMGLPLTSEGLVYAGIGLILGLLLLAGLERVVGSLFRRRRAA